MIQHKNAAYLSNSLMARVQRARCAILGRHAWLHTTPMFHQAMGGAPLRVCERCFRVEVW